MDRTDYVMIGDRIDTADAFLDLAVELARDAGDDEARLAIEDLKDKLSSILETIRDKRDSFPVPEFEYEYTFRYEYEVTGRITSPYPREAIEDEDLEALAMECEGQLWDGYMCPGSLGLTDWDCDDVRKVPVREVRV